MERIIEVRESRIQEIRGYMANSGKDCASGTCDHGWDSKSINAEDVVCNALESIDDNFFC
ncbi:MULTISPECIES: hypothetical protein [unclassified Erwinia]|uniref:hypothetical protein n=1 Tax=unclassified Erwinia TaxID=2622719 RepID=UPI0006FCF04A|nr:MULTISPECIES: hypothetical protein [unclassified Erwinia]KQN53519.1 hypothetical protein ASF13_15275 [Erwinia sp. Leaf53]PLV46062.1 hypothetical protein NV64_21850 [Erwinia sp. B116]